MAPRANLRKNEKFQFYRSYTELLKGKNSSVGTNAKEVRERAAVLQ